MEQKANPTLVGAFVLIVLAAAFLFVIWYSEFRAFREYQYFRLNFISSIAGLKVGSPVQYKGIDVGEVVEIQFNPDNIEQSIVIIQIDRDVTIKEDVVASTDLQGITGGTIIQIKGGTNESPPLLPEPDQKIAVMETRPSNLDEIIENAPKMLEQGMLLMTRLNNFFSDTHEAHFSEILQNINILTRQMADQEQGLQQLNKKLQNFADTSVGALQTFEQLNHEANQFLQKNKSLFEENMLSLAQSLHEFENLMIEMRATTESLNQSPFEFLFSGGYEGQPAP